PLRNSAEFPVLGDFNGDGHLDVIAASQFSSGASILLGKGDGTFREASPFAVGEAPAGGDAADFNGDGFLDLALTNYFSPLLPGPRVSVLRGRGRGLVGASSPRFPRGRPPLARAPRRPHP